MKYTVFVLYQVTPAWLKLSRQERNAFFISEIQPVFNRFPDQLRVRMFDAEAFHAHVSDVLCVACDDLQVYYFLMEALRDTALFSLPYLELRDVIVTQENGFRHYEAQLANG